VSTPKDRARSAFRGGFALLVIAAMYESVARSGSFPPALLPTLPQVARTLLSQVFDSTLLAS
jgi:ABC-type nitrate/sulfonate/bicarbonate transport system permease component